MSSISNSPVSPSVFFRSEAFEESITRELMDEFVRARNIQQIKASLSESNLFEDMLSKHCFEPEVLSELLIAAVKDNHQVIKEALSEDAGCIEPEEFEDPELEELVRLLFEYHAFDSITIHRALEKASKYGRIDLIGHILRNAEISTAMVADALLQGVEYGWVEVVELLLKQPASKDLGREVWCKALDLSHHFELCAIARSLIEAIGPVDLEEVKRFFLEHSPEDLEGYKNAIEVLAFIDECVLDIESIKQSREVLQSGEKRKRSYSC
jgi:hypothetical protein